MEYYFYTGLLAVFASLPMCALADVDVVIGIEWTYTVHNGEAWIGTGIEGRTAIPITTAGMIAIPETLGGCPVTRIEDYAFYWCDKISDVTIPGTVKNIGFRAFSRCGGIWQGLTIPDSVTNIADQAFWMCQGLSSVKIPSSVDRIGESAFGGCTSMTHAEIAARHIANSAFSGCGLYSVSMRDGVVDIECGAFSYCVSLTYLEIPISVARVDPFNSLTWCDKLRDVYVTKGDADRVRALLAPCCVASSISISNINFYERDYAVVYEPGLLGTGEAVRSTKTQRADLMLKGAIFKRPGYSQVGWSKTDGGDLEYCLGGVYSRDESVTLYPVWMAGKYEVLYDLNGGSFGTDHPDSAMFDAAICVSAPTRDGYVFMGWTISEGLDASTALWGEDFFSLRKIGTSHERCGNGQKNIYFKNLTARSSGSVRLTANWYDETFVVEDGVLVEYTGNDTCIVIPDAVTRIGDRAFFECSGLVSVTISSSVTNVGCSAFCGCTGLMAVNIEDVSAWCGITFEDEYANPLSCAHKLCVDGSEITDLKVPGDVQSIGRYAFCGCAGLMSVTIPQGVTNIGCCAFFGCNELSTVYVSIGDAKRVSELYPFDSSVAVVDPYVPTEVEASDGLFENCVRISWSATSGETSYDLHRSPTFAGSGRTIRRGATSPYFDTEVEPGMQYYYWVEAINSSGSTVSLIDTGYRAVSLSFDKLTDAYAAVGGDGRVSVTANASWSASSDVDWIVLGPHSSGKGNGSISYKVAASGVGHRLGRINVVAGSDTSHPVTNTITVTQSDFVIVDGVLKQYVGTGGNVTIPSGVTSIGDGAFCNCASLTSIEIPAGVISIGDFAFSGCGGLTSVTIPACVKKLSSTFPDAYNKLVKVTIDEGVTSVGDFAFEGCAALKLVTIPNGVTSIGNYAFYNCAALEAIVMPGSVVSIGGYAFYGCGGLKSVTIPSRATSIGTKSFSGCSKLKVFYVARGGVAEMRTKLSTAGVSYSSGGLSFKEIASDGEGYTEVVDGITWTYSVKDGGAIIGSSKGTVAISTATTGSVDIPLVLGGCPVMRVGRKAFCNCNGIISVTIADNVTDIGAAAFYGCGKITSVAIPSSVVNIGGSAFEYCKCLNSVEIPAGVTNIGASAFAYCEGLRSVVMHGGVLSIGERAFFDCVALASVTIPEGVIDIGGYAFYDCRSMTALTIPQSVINIGSQAFSGCSGLILDLEIPDKVTDIKWATFCSCSGLTSVMIPAGVTNIGDVAFKYCDKIKSLTIPDTVVRIGNSAFYGCSSLSSVMIPDGVLCIDGFAFYGCSGLASVVIPDGVTEIMWDAFGACTGLNSVTIPQGVTKVWLRAFKDCVGLSSVVLPVGISDIGDEAFSGCSRLAEVTIPPSVIGIGYHAFECCGGLNIVYVGKGDTERVRGLYEWPSNVTFREVEFLFVAGDTGAKVTGNAETGFVIKPSEGKTAVEVTIPQGVDAAKVTVEVSVKVVSVKPNGATVKIVSGGADITEFLDVPAADGNGVVDLTKATVKEEIVKEAMDPAKGAEIKLNAVNPSLKTANTRVGLFYTFSEGRTLGGMERSASKTGDGKPWSPEITVKGGNAAFYSIGVGKGE